MRKYILIICIVGFYLFVLPIYGVIYAQEDPPSDELTETDKQQITVLIQSIKDGINLFEDTFSTFVNSTPDVTQDPLVISEEYTISYTLVFRNVLLGITTPLIALMIVFKGIQLITTEVSGDILRSFFYRVLIVVCLFIVVPFILSYTIQISNVFIESISGNKQFSAFLIEYFDDVEKGVAEGDADSFAFFKFNPVVQGVGSVTSLPFTVPVFLMFLIFIFIGLQFIIRFISLYFLSILYPIVIPFALTSSTQNVVISYFKAWITFLLHQPAFMLGYVLTIKIVEGMLVGGVNFNVLLIYVGVMIFLAGINVMVSKIFGEALGTLSANFKVAATGLFAGKSVLYSSHRAAGSTIKRMKTSRQTNTNGLQKVKLSPGIQGGGKGGARIKLTKRTVSKKPTPKLVKGTKVNRKQPELKTDLHKIDQLTAIEKDSQSDSSVIEEFKKQGVSVLQGDKNLGILKATGSMYLYIEPGSKLSTLYLSIANAKTEGISRNELKEVKLENFKFIDLSNKKALEKHNNAVKALSRYKGKAGKQLLLSQSSTKKQILNFFNAVKHSMKTYGVKGVAVYADTKSGSSRIIKIYTLKKF